MNEKNTGNRRTAPRNSARTPDSRRKQSPADARRRTEDRRNTVKKPSGQRGGSRSAHIPFMGADVRRNDFVKRNDIVRVRSGIDRPMLVIIILLLCFGSIMVFSASYATANSELGDSFYYIKNQIFYALLGIGIMSVISFLDYRLIRKMVPIGFLIAAVLLIAVLASGFSAGVAKRWMQLGFISFQPSEVMKPMLALFLANYFANNQEKVTNYRDFWQSSFWGDWVPGFIVIIVCVEVALEKHLSGTAIMFFIGLVVIFCGGARKFWLLSAGGVGIFGTLIIYATNPYVRKRVDIFLHPENYSVKDETWQTIQGLNAVGSGGLLGVGLGNSYQKFSFVSQPQNDFIFSIVCEELGFVGAIAVIALFVLFVWRGFVIAMKAPDTFSSLAVIGIVAHVAIQAILNIAVVTSVIPNTGITLPFFSYGGSALVILMAEMGVILAVSRYSYKED